MLTWYADKYNNHTRTPAHNYCGAFHTRPVTCKHTYRPRASGEVCPSHVGSLRALVVASQYSVFTESFLCHLPWGSGGGWLFCSVRRRPEMMAVASVVSFTARSVDCCDSLRSVDCCDSLRSVDCCDSLRSVNCCDSLRSVDRCDSLRSVDCCDSLRSVDCCDSLRSVNCCDSLRSVDRCDSLRSVDCCDSLRHHQRWGSTPAKERSNCDFTASLHQYRCFLFGRQRDSQSVLIVHARIKITADDHNIVTVLIEFREKVVKNCTSLVVWAIHISNRYRYIVQLNLSNEPVVWISIDVLPITQCRSLVLLVRLRHNCVLSGQKRPPLPIH